jgi:hypothetical protein
MGLSIHYRSVDAMHPARAYEIKKHAAELNALYAWVGSDEVGLDQSTDGILAGSSATSFVIDAEGADQDLVANEQSAGDIATLIDVLCELSRCHDVDWEIEHDYEPDVVGCIRGGVADVRVLEELETIRAIGEMLGNFDEDFEDDLEDDDSYLDAQAVGDEQDGPRLLKFPGIR